MDAHLIEGLLNQFPVVALVLWLFSKFRAYEQQNRERWIGYMKERDAAVNKQLEGSAAAQFSIGTEIKTLSTAITRLDTRLKG